MGSVFWIQTEFPCELSAPPRLCACIYLAPPIGQLADCLSPVLLKFCGRPPFPHTLIQKGS